MNAAILRGAWLVAALLPAWAAGGPVSVRGFAPDPPGIGVAIADNASASVSFTAPAFDGGGVVLDYQARCGGAPVTGSGSPIIVAPLVNGVAVTCTVTARNQFDSSAPSAPSNNVIPRAPTSVLLVSSATPVAAGNPVTFTVTITPSTARGTVSFAADAATISGCAAVVVSAAGTASCSTAFGSVGMRAISASYSGDAAHIASSSTLAGGQTVIAPTITLAPALNDALTGVAYGPVQLSADGGAAAYGFAVSVGTLPTGLTLTGAGLLSGMPTQRANFSFTVRATDANGFMGTRAYSITIRSLPGAPGIGVLTAGNSSVTLGFTAPSDDGGNPITAYNVVCGTASASGASPPITVAGLSNGVPVSCRVNAVTSSGPGPASALSNTVTPQAPTTLQLQSSATPAIAGMPLTFTASLTPVSATGSVGFSADAVPISGCNAVPVSTGSAACTTTFLSTGTKLITAAYAGDAAHIASTATLAGGQVVIAPTIAIAPALGGGVVGTLYPGVQLLASGGVAPHSFAVTAGNLPAGLILSSAGALSGTPTTQGIASFTVTASDANGFTGTRAYSVAIIDLPGPPVIVSATPLNNAARITFNPPVNNGGSAILDYTASCTPGTPNATGAASPIDVGSLNNQWAYRCSLRARNAVGSSVPSAVLSVVPGSSGTSADLSISKSNGTSFVNGSAPVDYLITVSNPGPAAVLGARVEDALAPDFSAASWTCTALNNAACPEPASGTGALDARLDLPASSSVRINFSALPIAGVETPISNLASVTAPAGISDPTLSNNVASDGPDVRGLFRNGFE